ncbi:uncharacterized protein [Eurosta solidaginis]|uniref:uncharacterized protein n=1 Tax=Eurosta solidaginis TaxID=178769 RepID=UPI0035311048
MDSDDTFDLAIITVLLNEARKCLDIITGVDSEEEEAKLPAVKRIKLEGCKEESNSEAGDDDENAFDDHYDYDNPDEKFDQYIETMCHNDMAEFNQVASISKEAFDLLFDLVKRDLRRASHRAMSPKCRLFITLVYLANGGSKSTISLAFGVPPSTVNKILSETCQSLCKSLAHKYLPNKKSSDWRKISEQFESEGLLPNCVGAIDLRTIQLRCPKKDLVSFYQKKGKYIFSIFGACDAKYKFTGIDVAVHQNKEVGEVWTTGFESKVIKGLLHLPERKFLPNSNIRFPYYFVGDSTCALKPNIMRPFPDISSKYKRDNIETFNWHLNRTYQKIDNTFGVIAARWKIWTTPMVMAPKKMEIVVKATILLHNFALTHDTTSYMPFGYVDRYEGDTLIRGDWRHDIVPLMKPRKIYANNSTKVCFNLRNILSEYLGSTARDVNLKNVDQNSYDRNLECADAEVTIDDNPISGEMVEESIEHESNIDDNANSADFSEHAYPQRIINANSISEEWSEGEEPESDIEDNPNSDEVSEYEEHETIIDDCQSSSEWLEPETITDELTKEIKHESDAYDNFNPDESSEHVEHITIFKL